jgi:DNA-binding CsgD family transcriptional regulator
MAPGYAALTEKEKRTLRLLLDGHDAKSMARHLGLSVHTINERLREARRKLSVSSSKEAARLLRQVEGGAPETVVDKALGDAARDPTAQPDDQPRAEPRPVGRAAWAIGGLTMISLMAALLVVSSPADAPQAGAAAASAPAASEVTSAALDWLALVDAGQWAESWAATGASFRSLNTVEVWERASLKVRAPLGRVVRRTPIEESAIPAPPNGLRLVRFRTDFENKSGATETLSLDREGGGWRVVGAYIE